MTIINKIHSLFTSGKTLVLLDQAIVSGGNFALGILLARYLGLEAFGEYSLLWMGVLFMLSLHQAFISKPMMSLLAGKNVNERGPYLQSLMVLQLALSIALFLLSLCSSFLIKMVGPAVLWVYSLPLIGFLTAVYLLQEFLRKLFFVKQQYRQPLFMDFILYLFMLSGIVFLSFKHEIVMREVLWCMCLTYGMSSGLGLFLLLSKDGFPSFKKRWKLPLIKTLKEHYHYSFWLLGTSLVQWFSGNFFLIAAAGTLGTLAVGAMRMAQNMVGLCHVLFLAMENIIPAEAAQHFYVNGKPALYGYLKRTGLAGGVLVLFLLVTLTLSAPLLIKWLYGPEYEPYHYLVAMYSLLYIFVYIGFPLRFALRTLQTTSPIFVAYCVSAATSLLIAFPLAQTWGLNGIMAGLIIVQLLTLIVYVAYLRSQIVHRKSNIVNRTSQIIHFQGSRPGL